MTDRKFSREDARKVCMDYSLPWVIQEARREEKELFSAIGIVAGLAIVALVVAITLVGFTNEAYSAEPVRVETPQGEGEEIRWSRWCKITGLC